MIKVSQHSLILSLAPKMIPIEDVIYYIDN